MPVLNLLLRWYWYYIPFLILILATYLSFKVKLLSVQKNTALVNFKLVLGQFRHLKPFFFSNSWSSRNSEILNTRKLPAAKILKLQIPKITSSQNKKPGIQYIDSWPHSLAPSALENRYPCFLVDFYCFGFLILNKIFFGFFLKLFSLEFKWRSLRNIIRHQNQPFVTFTAEIMLFSLNLPYFFMKNGGHLEFLNFFMIFCLPMSLSSSIGSIYRKPHQIDSVVLEL